MHTFFPSFLASFFPLSLSLSRSLSLSLALSLPAPLACSLSLFISFVNAFSLSLLVKFPYFLFFLFFLCFLLLVHPSLTALLAFFLPFLRSSLRFPLLLYFMGHAAPLAAASTQFGQRAIIPPPSLNPGWRRACVLCCCWWRCWGQLGPRTLAALSSAPSYPRTTDAPWRVRPRKRPLRRASECA